jgi:hypothetical protein
MLQKILKTKTKCIFFNQLEIFMENVDLGDIESPFPSEKSIMSQICFESNVHNEEDQENVFVKLV